MDEADELHRATFAATDEAGNTRGGAFELRVLAVASEPSEVEGREE